MVYDHDKVDMRILSIKHDGDIILMEQKNGSTFLYVSGQK